MTFAKAKKLYIHRFTMEHVPTWAEHPAPNGKYYAPQYRTDQEWYDNTRYWDNNLQYPDCFSTRQTWPLGHWLDQQYRKSEAA